MVFARGRAGRGFGPDLSDYYFLTYAPKQWGDGVRTADSGTPVSAIADGLAEGYSAAELAGRYGTTVSAVRDAARYVARGRKVG